MLNPALFKLAKPAGEMRRSWFQIITTFLLCFVEGDRPCLHGLWFHAMLDRFTVIYITLPYDGNNGDGSQPLISTMGLLSSQNLRARQMLVLWARRQFRGPLAREPVLF